MGRVYDPARRDGHHKHFSIPARLATQQFSPQASQQRCGFTCLKKHSPCRRVSAHDLSSFAHFQGRPTFGQKFLIGWSPVGLGNLYPSVPKFSAVNAYYRSPLEKIFDTADPLLGAVQAKQGPHLGLKNVFEAFTYVSHNGLKLWRRW